MKYQLHHVALNVKDLEWHQNFFENVLDMTIRKTAGEAPNRKIWYHEGIQLNEAAEEVSPEGAMDHFALAAEDIDTVVARCIEAGCTKIDWHWVQMPTGVKIEFE